MKNLLTEHLRCLGFGPESRWDSHSAAAVGLTILSWNRTERPSAQLQSQRECVGIEVDATALQRGGAGVVRDAAAVAALASVPAVPAGTGAIAPSAADPSSRSPLASWFVRVLNWMSIVPVTTSSSLSI